MPDSTKASKAPCGARVASGLMAMLASGVLRWHRHISYSSKGGMAMLITLDTASGHALFDDDCRYVSASSLAFYIAKMTF